jgi:GR25 family glycosyltransferase involved in LPS biosynthesis
MEIHVINLKRDVEKWKLFIKQVKPTTSPHLKFTRFNAIDGTQAVNNINISSICNDVICNNGIIGCAQSHISLWKQLVDSHSNYYIIMEDDAQFNTKQLEYTLNTIDTFLSDKDNLIISLMCVGPFCNVGTSHQIGNYTAIASLFPLCTTAYIITKGAARHLLNEMKETVRYHIDFEIAKHLLLSKDVTYLVMTPNIVTARNIDSSIGSKHKYSILFGWSNRIMWYCNIPIWKFSNLYSSVLLLLLLIFLIVGIKRRRPIYTFIILFIILELFVFNKM